MEEKSVYEVKVSPYEKYGYSVLYFDKHPSKRTAIQAFQKNFKSLYEFGKGEEKFAAGVLQALRTIGVPRVPKRMGAITKFNAEGQSIRVQRINVHRG